MKILQIATLVTPDGAYGGPIRVAVNQIRELRRRGHDALLVAGTSGFAEIPTSVDGVPVRLFPVRRLVPKTGFAGLTSPAMRAWLAMNAARFDIAHIHVARDLVTLPAVRAVQRAGLDYVLQPHGMIDPSRHPLARPLDATWTRAALRRAARVFYLTEAERRGLLAVAGPNLALENVVNGVPRADEPAAGAGIASGAEPERGASAGGVPARVEVLYLARLHARKRPALLAQVALALDGKKARVSFAGPDEGERAEVERLAAERPDSIVVEQAIAPDATLDRMAACDIYVLPSVDEPFPMSVLEAMSLAKPVIVTDTCGLAPAIADAGAGIVVDATPEALEAALRRLIDNPRERQRMGSNALQLARERFSMDAVADVLIDAYSLVPSRAEL